MHKHLKMIEIFSTLNPVLIASLPWSEYFAAKLQRQYYFNPTSSGFINRNFAEVKPDGITYCYTLDLLGYVNTGNSIPNTSILIKMENNTTLSAEKRSCNCTCTPYTFSNFKMTYTR